ncbi:uncharacterized protein LOC135521268 [Oncorhynchus masou masou]|uniref:uncharacterized protein LOC135521268 n=1 Tax=Oncorhynchus masou masou TaxID=90313 RepID=UPI0031836EA3
MTSYQGFTAEMRKLFDHPVRGADDSFIDADLVEQLGLSKEQLPEAIEATTLNGSSLARITMRTEPARWALFFGRFNFSLTFRPGSKNGKSDALSRMFSKTDESGAKTETILPQNLVVGAVTWRIEEDAAFDTVNHQILLSTLSELGISGAAHAWIASYLTGRSYQVANRISACLADISVWMTDHHLKLNLGKTELLFLPGKDCPFHDLAITVDNSIVSSSQSAKNLGVILDNTLSFSTNIKAVARSCRFMLYNIRRVRPCLTQEAAQVLIQALVISRLDYCNSLLAGLPACAIKPLQLIQNAAARLVFNLPKFSHVTPLLRSLHWLPVEARIRYKTMVLAYGSVRGTAPQYLQALIRPYTQTRALRSSTSGLLASLPLRKYSSRSAQSKLFAALAPQWWNKLPHDARTAESITTFRRHLKPHLFKEYLG